MTLDQLRVFVAVAEREHVTRAASALNLAQSAVSHAVALLEAEFRTQLFDRVGRRIVLTEAGRTFLVEARAVLARADAARAVLAELGDLERGSLRVHASQTIAGYWLPARLAALHRRHPGIEIGLRIGNTEQVARAVHDGEAEIGLIEGAIHDPALLSSVVAHDQLVLVVAPAHPWAHGPSPGSAALAAADWVLREPGSGTRSAFESAIARLGVPAGSLRVALQLPSNESVRAAVESGLGATALSASVAAPSIEAGLLVRVPMALPERAFRVVHHRERSLGRAARAFLAGLESPPAETRA